MATSLNKYSFRCIHMLTPFCIKTNLRENRFFAAKWTVGGKKGTHNVKISTENLTKIIILHARASGQRHRKDVRLQQPARAVVGECCSQPTKTTSWKSRSNLLSTNRFQLVESVWNILPPSAFWNITTFCHRQMGQYFRFLSYLRPVLCAWAECLSRFYHTKKINSTQFTEPLKVKTASMSWWKLFVSQLQTRLYAHYKRLVVSVQAAL